MKFLILIFLIFFTKVYSEKNNTLPCRCRLNNLNRIVNGLVANEHSIPWMASFSYEGNNHFCGGSILNENFILTSAHCISKLPQTATNIMVRLGVQNLSKLNDSNAYYIKRAVLSIITDPYNIGDIAFIELQRSIKFEKNVIEPACVNLKNDEFFDGDLLEAGWGYTAKPWRHLNEPKDTYHYEPKDYENLKYYFSTQSRENCLKHLVCTVPNMKNDSVCIGDSGGPLMYIKNGTTSVIGIASFVGQELSNDKLLFCVGKPVYARFKFYKNFFKKFIKNYCEPNYN